MFAALGHLIYTVARVILLLGAVRVGLGLCRICPRSRAAWRHLPVTLWTRARWRWLCRSLQLAYLDRHRRRTARPKVPFGSSVRVLSPGPGEPARLRFPRAIITPDPYGIRLRVRTIPGTGRAEFEQQAEHLANAMRCYRVQVTQPKPGRIELRGIRRDPLLQPLDHSGSWPDEFPHRLPLGLDEFGTRRSLRLGRNTTGVVVAGLPGTGKTSLIGSWLGDLAGTLAAQFVILDGKSPDGITGDYADWLDRCQVLTGDDLGDAEAALMFAHDQLRQRLATVAAVTGGRNVWTLGHPSASWPLLCVVLDEAHTFFDREQHKGDRKAEDLARRCVALTSQLIRRGGSVAVLVVMITQKVTGDSLPTILRDNSALAVAFGLKTTEASVAALGEGIRKWPGYDPTTLQGPEMVGVCTAALKTGSQPYVRLRVPFLTEAAAAERAIACAPYRGAQRSPAEVPAVEVLAAEPAAVEAA